MYRPVFILNCPELECSLVLLYVFRELCDGFKLRGHTVKEISSIGKIDPNGIVFMGNAFKRPLTVVNDMLNTQAPEAIYIGWYWHYEPLVVTLKHFLYTHQDNHHLQCNHLTLHQKIQHLPNRVPLLLRANEDPAKIGTYIRNVVRDYCYMGWVYSQNLIPQKYSTTFPQSINQPTPNNHLSPSNGSVESNSSSISDVSLCAQCQSLMQLTPGNCVPCASQQRNDSYQPIRQRIISRYPFRSLISDGSCDAKMPNGSCNDSVLNGSRSAPMLNIQCLQRRFTGIYHGICDHKQFLPYDQRRSIYLSSHFALGFQSPENKLDEHVSQRIFEGLAYGCVVLSDSKAACEQTDNIVQYVSTKEEVETKMQYFFQHPDEMEVLRQKGYEFVQQSGTNQHSINLILHTIHTLWNLEI